VPDPRVRYGQVIKQRALAASGISDPPSSLRGSGVDSAQANFGIALGMPERDDSAALRTTASQDARFR
jgi:hypothetical protein